jgi:hypothetical protein
MQRFICGRKVPASARSISAEYPEATYSNERVHRENVVRFNVGLKQRYDPNDPISM